MSINRPDPLQAMPDVGQSIAADLRALGVEDPTDLRGKDPERLYARSNALRGSHAGPVSAVCLPVRGLLREHEPSQPELLKWWNWSDAALAPRGVSRAGATRAATSSRRRSRARQLRDGGQRRLGGVEPETEVLVGERREHVRHRVPVGSQPAPTCAPRRFRAG